MTCPNRRFVQATIMISCSARASRSELNELFVLIGDGLSVLSIEFCS